MARVFLSFNYEDIASKKTVDNWKKQNIGSDICFTSEDGYSYSDKGEILVKKILKDQIAKAHLVLVLVGNDTHNRPWVNYEISYAKTHGKKVIWTQIPGTTGGPPKEIINTVGLPFNMNQIQQAIRQI